MLATLRAFNARVVSTKTQRNADASQASGISAPSTVHFTSYAKNSRQGRMISMAQAWKKRTTVAQLEHSLRLHPLPGLHMRTVHTSRPSNGLAHGAWSVTPKAVGLAKNTQYEYFQGATWLMAAALPIGFLFSPSILNLPMDLVLGFAVPFHAWYGMHHVVEDYVPAAYRPASNMLLYLITAVTVLGLLNLNLRGDGIVESIKGLWRKEDKDKKVAAK